MNRFNRRSFIKNVLRTVSTAALTASPLAGLAYRAFADAGAAAAAGAGKLIAPPPQAFQNRVIPDLSEANIVRFTAGLRPYRHGGMRIQREQRFGKILVHNYGHAGGGITLAWGSAAAAVDLIKEQSRIKPVAVLGGGVIGLSVAHELRARGFPVTIYATKWHPEVTSSVAGGQWSPALVGHFHNDQDKARYNQILEASFKKYGAFAGPQYGIRMIDNILSDDSDDPLRTLNMPSLPAHYHLDKLPFENATVGGDVYRSWLIEPPIYLPALTDRLRRQEVKFVTVDRPFQRDDNEGNRSSAVERLQESIVFNCLGLGAKELIVDDGLKPIRGRLIHLRPDPRVDYLLLQDGYMFSRSDVIVLGGTYDENQVDLSFDANQYEHILKLHRSFFNIQNLPPQLVRNDIPYKAYSL